MRPGIPVGYIYNCASVSIFMLGGVDLFLKPLYRQTGVTTSRSGEVLGETSPEIPDTRGKK